LYAVVNVVNRPQDEEALSFFGEEEGAKGPGSGPGHASHSLLAGVWINQTVAVLFLACDLLLGAEPVFLLVTVLPAACLIEFVGA
jgi:hypothetical protein